jgi:predicted GH43/DUF377 family glycosyl hydrolase
MRIKNMRKTSIQCGISLIAFCGFISSLGWAADRNFLVLNPDAFKAEMGEQSEWIIQNVPLFECPDKNIQEIYYFRLGVFKKHIKETPDGYIITEFTPDVSWAGKYNSISCAAGHHIYEGRWIRDPRWLDDYSLFWFRKGGEPRRYSFWAADAMWARYLVNRNAALAEELLPDLVKNYEAWEKTRLDPNALFWQIDDRDGMEYSIGGSGHRPTINSYMYGDAMAIANIAELARQNDLAKTYRDKAARIKNLVQANLWDKQADFFKTLPRGKDARLVDVREEVGFVPWYFNLPDPGYEATWKQIMDPAGFYAPFGPTTAERRHPRFRFTAKHDCLWNGPSWPYATAQTLVAMANVLNNYDQKVISKKDYLAILTNYAQSQHKNGKPWIAEDLDGVTGQWIVDKPRSVDYNHSAYCDLVITGLVGLRPHKEDIITVHPLLPEGVYNYFCLDGVLYHGRSITIMYDKTGERYRRGAGLYIFSDGKQIAKSDGLDRVNMKLPPEIQSANKATDRVTASTETSAGWIKSERNPVLGGNLGTCFDVSVLKEEKAFRMWFSWRPKKSIALVESDDGAQWSQRAIVLGPNTATDWENDINRPVVVERPDGYHLWYTAQAKGRSWIGYATSHDGRTWTRASAKPVLSPEAPWEKVAVMCPHVIWDDPARLFRMWYSGGEQYEPDAIGYATSPDGRNWTKSEANPIFRADPNNPWEKHKVTACQVVRQGDWHLMFYIGFRDVDHAQIGLARSRDGISNWQRHSANPIIRPGENQWDHDACYKPYAILDDGRWLLWYNGRRGSVEQIGLAIHEGVDLGF